MPSVRTQVAITKFNTFAGVDIPFVTIDPTNGMQVNDTGRVLVVVESTGTATCDVLITSKADAAGRSGDVVQTIAAGAVHVFGPFPDSSIWGDGTNLFVDFYAPGGGAAKTPLTGQTLSQLKIAAGQA